MRQGSASGLKSEIVSMPLTPSRVDSQKASTPLPLGLTAPNPLTTTRRRAGRPLFALILTRRRQSQFHLGELISQVPFSQKSPLPPFFKGGTCKTFIAKGDL